LSPKRSNRQRVFEARCATDNRSAVLAGRSSDE
jgi:hypothetical protein